MQAIVTNVVVWSQVEAGAAVIAACLPTLRPLVLGHSVDSLVGSIRSALSLNSIERSPNAERRGSDSEALTNGNEVHLHSLRAMGSKSSHLETLAARGSVRDDGDVPANRIMTRNVIAFEEEHLGDLEAKGALRSEWKDGCS